MSKIVTNGSLNGHHSDCTPHFMSNIYWFHHVTTHGLTPWALKKVKRNMKTNQEPRKPPKYTWESKTGRNSCLFFHRLCKLKHMEATEVFLACYIRNSRSHFKQAVQVPEAKIHNNDMVLHRCCLSNTPPFGQWTLQLEELFLRTHLLMG